MQSEAVTQRINELLEQVPELRPAYDEHIHDNDELLSHVFFGDVARYVVTQVRSGATGSSQPVARIMNFLEECMASKDKEMRELISVSFVENLAGHEDILASLKTLAGPTLAKELTALEE